MEEKEIKITETEAEAANTTGITEMPEAEQDTDSPAPAQETDSMVPAEGTEKKERGPEEESQRMVRIKVGITTLAIIIVGALDLLNWNGDGNFQMMLSAADRYDCCCTVADESVIQISSETVENGKYLWTFDAVGDGTTEVKLVRLESDSGAVAEERIYTLSVTEGSYIVQKSVQRTIY